MARGGKRTGAGRKAGAANTKTREIADKAATDGITPLEVMLLTMRSRWASQDEDGALVAAEKAAPYIHARLASVDNKHSGNVSIETLLESVDGRTRGLPKSG